MLVASLSDYSHLEMFDSHAKYPTPPQSFLPNGENSNLCFFFSLRELIAKLGEKESAVRKAGAWIVEKLSRAKIQLSETREGEMGLFLALEGLALGINGKRSLWRALATASETAPHLRGPDYATLEKRAVEQHDRVEAKRLEIAPKVFESE